MLLDEFSENRHDAGYRQLRFSGRYHNLLIAKTPASAKDFSFHGGNRLYSVCKERPRPGAGSSARCAGGGTRWGRPCWQHWPRRGSGLVPATAVARRRGRRRHVREPPSAARLGSSARCSGGGIQLWRRGARRGAPFTQPPPGSAACRFGAELATEGSARQPP